MGDRRMHRMAATEQSTRANAALDDLYRRHVGDVYRYTYAVLGNHADAEDVTQTTFVNALRALERGEEPRNASSWLVAIAHNLVRQRWRQAAARPTEIELVGDVAAATQEDDLELDDLVKALQRIPPAQREALVMRELEGRSYQEISELLGVTNSALETLLFRARRSLADELENLVTCQTAELAMSQRLDGRLSRKERRRLKEHLGECASCARLAEMQGKQRRAFKGLALLPLPVGLTLFKGVPSATAAAGLSSIGGAATGATGGSAGGVGAATTTTVGATGVGVTGATTTGGAAVGGSLVGGAVAKVAAVVVAATVATGVGYQGLEVIRADSPKPTQRQLERPGPAAAASKAAARRSVSRRSSATSFAPAPGVASEPTGSARRLEPTQRVQNVLGARADAAQPAATSAERQRNQDGGRTPGQQSSGRAPSPEAPAATISRDRRCAARDNRHGARGRPGPDNGRRDRSAAAVRDARRDSEWLSRRRNRPWQRRWLRPRTRADRARGSRAGRLSGGHERYRSRPTRPGGAQRGPGQVREAVEPFERFPRSRGATFVREGRYGAECLAGATSLSSPSRSLSLLPWPCLSPHRRPRVRRTASPQPASCRSRWSSSDTSTTFARRRGSEPSPARARSRRRPPSTRGRWPRSASLRTSRGTAPRSRHASGASTARAHVVCSSARTLRCSAVGHRAPRRSSPPGWPLPAIGPSCSRARSGRRESGSSTIRGPAVSLAAYRRGWSRSTSVAANHPDDPTRVGVGVRTPGRRRR